MAMYKQGGLTAWVFIGALGAILVALFIFNTINKPASPHLDNSPWRAEMMIGSAEAENTFVRYTDYFCSFCAELHEQIASDKFRKEYIDSGKLKYETRIITVLKDMVPNTEQGAEAGHCAADQGKFQEFSDHIVPRIKKDYFDKGIGVKNVANPVTIEKLPIDYFQESAQAVDLDVDKFTTCVENETHKDEIAQHTKRAINLGVTGLPYTVVNATASSGFQGGWSGLEMLLKAGGVE